MPVRAKVCQDANSRNLWVREEVLVVDDFSGQVVTNSFDNEDVLVEDEFASAVDKTFEETGKNSSCLNSFVLNTEVLNSDTTRVFDNQINVEDSFSGYLH